MHGCVFCVFPLAGLTDHGAVRSTSREDKTPEQCTNAQQIADMYSNQDVVKNNLGGGERFS